MILRHGKISGFVDELVDSLLDVDQADLLSNYSSEVTGGASDVDSTIKIPIVFVYLHEPSYEQAVAAPVLEITAEQAFIASQDLLTQFNNALSTSNIATPINIKFYLSDKPKLDGDIIDYPGSILIDTQDFTSEVTYYGALEEGGFGFVTRTFTYYRDGIAVGDEDSFGNPIVGVNKSVIDEAVAERVDTNNVFTVVLANKLNATTINDDSETWAYTTGVHPAVADVKPYYTILPYYGLRETTKDYLGVDVAMQLAMSSMNWYPNVTFPSEEELVIVYPKPLYGHIIGSMFGLLPLGVSSLSIMQNSFPEGTCETTTGCILTGGEGDCCDDLPPITTSNYFSTVIRGDYVWGELADCEEELENWWSPTLNNPMNFILDSYETVIGFSNDQIHIIRSGFETNGTVLKQMKDTFSEYMSPSLFIEYYCEDYPNNVRAIQIKKSSSNKNYSEEASKFNSIKTKVELLCNNIVYK